MYGMHAEAVTFGSVGSNPTSHPMYTMSLLGNSGTLDIVKPYRKKVVFECPPSASYSGYMLARDGFEFHQETFPCGPFVMPVNSGGTVTVTAKPEIFAEILNRAYPLKVGKNGQGNFLSTMHTEAES